MRNDIIENEPVGVRRLRLAREALAELERQQAEHHEDTDPAPVPGSARTLEQDVPDVLPVGATFHALASGLTLPRTTSIWGGEPPIVTERGRAYVLTEEMRRAAINKLGHPGWPAVVRNPEAQIRKWGKQYLAEGPVPEGMQTWIPGSPEWAEARSIAHKAALAEPNPDVRATKLAEVKKVYGDPPQSGQSMTYGPDRRYLEQEERIRNGGVRHREHVVAREAGAPER